MNGDNPKVSVIVPVCNTEKYLHQCLDSILGQTLQDIEVICVDDESTDSSLSILREYEAKDSRVKVIPQEKSNAGAARNNGLLHARGTYCIFLDADDFFEPTLLEKTYSKAVADNADIVAFNFYRYYEDGTTEKRIGIHREWLTKNKKVFNYQDCPGYAMSIVNPTPWTKLYRTDFILDHKFKFEEISSTNDITFAAVSIAFAQRISVLDEYLVYYRVSHAGTITSTKTKKLGNVMTAVKSGVKQISAHPEFETLKNSAMRFAVENIVFAFRRVISDFNDSVARNFYTDVKAFFNTPFFNDCSTETLHSQTLYDFFRCIRDDEYIELVEMVIGNDAPKNIVIDNLIVSLTSYPPRISTAHRTIETLLNQTIKPSKLILWLSDDEFPNREDDLPKELLAQTARGLQIEWCKNIGPYKKLIPALEKYPAAIIVTADDDLYYHEEWLERLYMNYLKYPDYISCHRITKFIIEKDGQFSAVVGGKDYWPFPSYLNKLVGAGGTLFPPHCFHPDVMNESIFMELAPTSDDIWFWLMATLAGYKVTPVQNPLNTLNYVEGTQDCGLWRINDHGEKLFWVHFNNILQAYPQLDRRLRNAWRETAGKGIAPANLEDMKVLQNKLNRKEKELQSIRSSISFKTGRAITFAPRIMRRGIRYYRKHGAGKTLRRTMRQLKLWKNKNNPADTTAPIKRDYAYYSSLPAEKYPEELKLWYKRITHEDLDLDNPKTANEKIQWIKLYDSTPLKTRLADKYLVRDWVKEKIGEEYLIPLLGVWDSFDGINFEQLPEQFVLKANHGSGWNIVVKNKATFNKEEAREKFDIWMHTNFAFKWGLELHYLNIPPKIIAEQYMENLDQLIDYKVWCSDGKARFIWVDTDRFTDHKRPLFSLDWKKLPITIGPYSFDKRDIPKPVNLDKMISFAELMSKEFCQVRVDFYEVDGKLYFGEMTFTSTSGSERANPRSFEYEMGSWITLPPKQPIPTRLID